MCIINYVKLYVFVGQDVMSNVRQGKRRPSRTQARQAAVDENAQKEPNKRRVQHKTPVKPRSLCKRVSWDLPISTSKDSSTSFRSDTSSRGPDSHRRDSLCHPSSVSTINKNVP